MSNETDSDCRGPKGEKVGSGGVSQVSYCRLLLRVVR